MDDSNGILGLIGKIEDARHHRELVVMHCVIHDPQPGIQVAKELGAGLHLFSRDDMRAMWIVCESAGRHGRNVVERMVLGVLREEGLLSARGRGINGLWNEQVLARFVRHFSDEPATAIQRTTLFLLVPRLIETYTTQREARRYLNHACDLLERGAA